MLRLILPLGAALAVACERGAPPDAAECRLLLDRYTELLTRQSRPRAPADEIRRLQAQARTLAEGDPAFHECPRRVSRSAYECAMSAPDADSFERCIL